MAVLPDRLKSLLGIPSQNSGTTPSPRSRTDRSAPPAETITRHSTGLEQFLTYIRDETGLKLLDLGGANQENITYITQLGHKLFAEDPIRALRQSNNHVPTEPMHPSDIEAFLEQNLDYPEEFFDGVLMWDVLEYMEPRLLGSVLERMRRIVKPHSCLLGIFRAHDRAIRSPFYSYRIADTKTMILSHRGMLEPVQVFNNRNLEKLFQSFETVKFFLSRDGLRDVLVRR